MIPALIFAALAAAPQPSASPVPKLPTIVTVRTTPYCDTVRTLAAPLAFVDQRNDQAFDAINRSMLAFMKANRGLSQVSQADVTTLDNGYDDSAIYNAHNTVSMNRLSQIVWQINQNLSLEDDYMTASWKKYPQGTHPDVDALRKRVQNLIDLQRALAAKYTQLADYYFDNEGNSQFSIDPQTGDTNDVVMYKALLREVILGQTSAMALANNEAATRIVPALHDASDVAHAGNTKDIVEQLRLQESAFAPEAIKAANSCGL